MTPVLILVGSFLLDVDHYNPIVMANVFVK